MRWYKYDIRDLSDFEYNQWYSLMNETKQRRVDKFRFMEDRKRTVAGEMLARKAIAAWCNVKAESIVFSRREFGKPFAVGLPIEFNISHSGDMVVCVVSDKPVGIDIEKVRSVDSNVVKAICAEGDLICFFENWTAKEAYGKCVGTGMGDLRKNENGFAYFVEKIDDYVMTICMQNKF